MNLVQEFPFFLTSVYRLYQKSIHLNFYYLILDHIKSFLFNDLNNLINIHDPGAGMYCDFDICLS